MLGKSFAFAAIKGTLGSKEHWASTEQMLGHSESGIRHSKNECLRTDASASKVRMLNGRLTLPRRHCSGEHCLIHKWLKIHERLTFSELGIFASFTRKMLTNLKICFSINGDDHPIRRSELLRSNHLCRV